MFPNTHFDVNILSNNNDYAKVFQSGYFSDLIDFNEDFLSGSWDGKYGLITFRDDSNNEELRSRVELHKDLCDESRLKVSIFPYNIVKSYINPIVNTNRTFSNHDHIKNRKQGSFITFTSDDIIPDEVFDTNKWTEHHCSNPTLSLSQFNNVMLYINTLDNKEAILDHYYINLNNDIEIMYNEMICTQTHLEKPYELCVHGNDDTSYIKLFATEKEAWDCYNDMKHLAGNLSGNEILAKYDFVYL